MTQSDFEFKERVCAHMPNGQHLIIIQALHKDSQEIVWAIGDDQVCAITREDFVRGKIPYNNVLIQEFPYRDYTPESVGEWRPLVESLVSSMLKKYMEYDGLVHVYPQWLPAAAYEHYLCIELFAAMAGGCDHIILHGDPPEMEFVPRKDQVNPDMVDEKQSVVKQIREGKASASLTSDNKRKKHSKGAQER